MPAARRQAKDTSWKQRWNGSTRGAILLLLLCGCIAPRIQAQSTTAGVVGTIHDQTGSVVPEAAVTITNKGTSEIRKTTSGADGAFAFNLLSPGSYRISVTAPNFKRYEVPDLTLAAGDKPRIDAGLSLGAVTETVSV